MGGVKLKKKALIILILLVMLIPYGILFQDYANTIICLAAAIYIAVFVKEIRGNKKYILLMTSLLIVGIVSLLFTNSLISSLEGLTVYINALLFYIIFADCKSCEDISISTIVYSTAASSLFYIILQGAVLKGGVLKGRIDGNIGYANSYALLLLIGIFLNELMEENKFKDLIQIILTIGIFYTGSRNTLLYLAIYIIYRCVKNIKSKDKFGHVLNVFAAGLLYYFIESAGLGIIIILPLAIILLYPFLKMVSYEIKNYASIIIAILIIPLALFAHTNLSERIKSMSINSNELRQRIIYYEDAIKHIKVHPLGSGINTFVYRQASDQSAYYDVRYIHNSVLQTGYDIGIIGMLLFLLVAVFGGILVYKSKSKHRQYYLVLYCCIYLHSLLDFDFSYTFTFIILAMIAALCSTDSDADLLRKSMLMRIKKICIPLFLVFSIYLTVLGTFCFIGDKLYDNGEYEQAINFYKIDTYLSVDEYSYYFKMGDSYCGLENKNGDKKLLSKAVEAFKKAYAINQNDSSIPANLGFVYAGLGEKENAIKYLDKFTQKNKYSVDIYRQYDEFLEKWYKETENDKYKQKQKELRDKYEQNYKKLTPNLIDIFGTMPSSI